MSDLTNYAENAIGNHVLRNTALTSPTTVYLALATAVADAEAGTFTEVSTSGTGYSRKAITFGAPSNGVFTNSADVTYDAATGSWGTVTHGIIMDALAGGNALVVKALSTPAAVTTPNVYEIVAGQLSFTIA
jgi:hypothetical protein